jgi:hypothetical protein
MKAGLSQLHWLKWWVLFDTAVIRSAILINVYNFIHELFMGVPPHRTAIHRPQSNAALKCFVGRRSHVQVPDQKPVAVTEASCGFPQSLMQISGCQATTTSSQTLPTIHVLTNLQTALLSVDKKNHDYIDRVQSINWIGAVAV